MNEALRAALRVVWITDGRGDPDRLVALARRVVAGGGRAVQVREPSLDESTFLATCDALRAVFRDVDGVVLANRRVAAVRRGVADGVHVGSRGPGPSLDELGSDADLGRAIVGFSAHDRDDLRLAAAAGCAYASLSPVFATSSHPDVEPLGLDVVRDWTAGSRVPVVWLGGIDGSRLAELPSRAADGAPVGIAVLGAIGASRDPAAVTRTLCAWGTGLA